MLQRIALTVLFSLLLLGCQSPPAPVKAPQTAAVPDEPRVPDVAPAPFVPPVEDVYLKAARSGGAYLMRMIESDGRYIYQYDPDHDHIAEDYNMLRHLGTTYSMWELYEVTRDPAIARAMEAPMRFAVSRARHVPNDTQRAVILDEEGEGVLGANGLALLMFTKHAQVTGSREHLPLMRKLARWVISLQTPEGEFDPHIVHWENQQPSIFKSLYYPGEAIFWLVRLYEIDPDPQWLDAAERAAGWLVKSQTNPNLRLDEVIHDHWLVYGLSALHKHRPDPRWITHAHLICLSMITSQNTPRARHPEWAGGWYFPPRTTPTSTRCEALMAAFDLFTRTGDPSFAGECLKTARDGMMFVLKFQLPDTPATRGSGGIRGGFDDPLIRIDYVQHAVSALLMLNRVESPATQPAQSAGRSR
jgi:hypothetical protein